MKKLTIEQQRIAQAKYKAKKKAEGKCWRCRAATINALCDDCLAQWKIWGKKRITRLLADGLCMRCGHRPHLKGIQVCQECRGAIRHVERKRKERLASNGTCTKCGKEQASEGYRLCDKCRMRTLEDNRKVKERLIDGYGGCCACCGEYRYEFLTLDHVNGNGKEERHLRPGQIYRRLIKEGFPDGYQILCYNCNCAKGIYGICPHTWAETEFIAPRDKPNVNYHNRNNSKSTSSDQRL